MDRELEEKATMWSVYGIEEIEVTYENKQMENDMGIKA